MMQVKEVCIRFTKMIIACSLPTLTCSKFSESPYWGVHLITKLVESTFFFFTFMTNRLVQLNNHVSVPSFPQLAQKFLSAQLMRCIFRVDNLDCWVNKTCLYSSEWKTYFVLVYQCQQYWVALSVGRKSVFQSGFLRQYIVCHTLYHVK